MEGILVALTYLPFTAISTTSGNKNESYDILVEEIRENLFNEWGWQGVKEVCTHHGLTSKAMKSETILDVALFFLMLYATAFGAFVISALPWSPTSCPSWGVVESERGKNCSCSKTPSSINYIYSGPRPRLEAFDQTANNAPHIFYQL